MKNAHIDLFLVPFEELHDQAPVNRMNANLRQYVKYKHAGNHSRAERCYIAVLYELEQFAGTEFEQIAKEAKRFLRVIT